MNFLNKYISMNVFQLRGMAFIPDNENPGIGRESDSFLLDVIFSDGLTKLCKRIFLMPRLAYIHKYIYSIHRTQGFFIFSECPRLLPNRESCACARSKLKWWQ
jgi:hypothetical protein